MLRTLLFIFLLTMFFQNMRAKQQLSKSTNDVHSTTKQNIKSAKYLTLNAHSLLKLKSEYQIDTDKTIAFNQFIQNGNDALNIKPMSVVEKTILPPSGNIHDYYSLAPYHWPDPSKSDGLPYIYKDGQINPEYHQSKDADYLIKLSNTVYDLGIAYFLTDNAVYANQASKLLKVWFLDEATLMNPNLNHGQVFKGSNTGTPYGIVENRYIYKLLEGCMLLSKSELYQAEVKSKLDNWMERFLNWMLYSELGKKESIQANNHSVAYDLQVIPLMMYLNKNDSAKEFIKRKTIPRLQSQFDDKGGMPLELARTNSFGYATGTLLEFYQIAILAENLGIDLWNYPTKKHAILKKGINYHLPFITNNEIWMHSQLRPTSTAIYDLLLHIAWLKYSDSKYKKAFDMRGDIKFKMETGNSQLQSTKNNTKPKAYLFKYYL